MNTLHRVVEVKGPTERIVAIFALFDTVQRGHDRQGADRFLRARGRPRELKMGRRRSFYSFTRLSRNALPITETDDSDIAAAAIMGDNRMPKNG